jgi:hypothetical protein
MWKFQFPANPVAGISPFPVPDQALQDISRSTNQPWVPPDLRMGTSLCVHNPSLARFIYSSHLSD